MEMANFFAEYGVTVIIDVGENNSGGAATSTDAKQYKSSHNYVDPAIVVADPKWQNTAYAVTHGNSGTISLPHMILLKGDMTILYSGNDLNQIVQLLATETGAQFQPTVADGTCDGACGGQMAAGCYCDDQCYQYGDCCSDVCDVCGFCN
jgi:hypothetical protein